MKRRRKSKSRFRRKGLRSLRSVDKRSIRTIFVGKHGKRLLVACPRGQWMPRKKRCRAGMAGVSLLTPKKRRRRSKKHSQRSRRNPVSLSGMAALHKAIEERDKFSDCAHASGLKGEVRYRMSKELNDAVQRAAASALGENPKQDGGSSKLQQAIRDRNEFLNLIAAGKVANLKSIENILRQLDARILAAEKEHGAGSR
jgi:hypothetical protein